MQHTKINNFSFITKVTRSCQTFDKHWHPHLLVGGLLLVCLLIYWLFTQTNYSAQAHTLSSTDGKTIRMRMTADYIISERFSDIKQRRFATDGEAVRATADLATHNSGNYAKMKNMSAQWGLVQFIDGSISVGTKNQHIEDFFALLPEDTAFTRLVTSPPLREEIFATCTITGSLPFSSILRFTANKSSQQHVNKERITKYRAIAERYAMQYNLSPNLIMAIMQTESNFNPSAVSPMRALGLMQIVPYTAGGEVHSYLKGFSGTPNIQKLMEPEKNIQYGVAYLHILSSRYFFGVKNKTARELCMIAAYNGGPGAVLRIFGTHQTDAVATINSMSSFEVYKTLITRMPARESRIYVDRVLHFAGNSSFR